jgi:hypothetical protein
MSGAQLTGRPSTKGIGLAPVADADIQRQCLLADSAFCSLHYLGDLRNRCLALRMRLQIANIFLTPSNTLRFPFVFVAMNHILPSCRICEINGMPS